MRKVISILLIYCFVFGQVETTKSPTDKNVSDKLVLNSRTDMGKYYTVDYYGEFLGHKQNKIYFKPTNEVLLKQLRLKEIKVLTQNDRVLIQNGKWKIEPENIKTFTGTFIDPEELNIEELSIEEKAVYDATADTRKWLFYPLLTGFTFVSSIYGSLIIIKEEPWESLPIMIGISTASLVVPYIGLNNLDKNQSAKISPEDIELYKKIYSEKFKKRKLKNIVIGSGLLGLTAGVGFFIFLSTFSLDFGPSSNAGFH